MKKNYSDFQLAHSEIDVLDSDWLKNSIKLIEKSHLICFGTISDLQFFGTSLIQKCGQIENSEISSIYGKLASNEKDFCYQLCHSTPWGFEIGTHPSAIQDVLLGENGVTNKFYIWYDADVMFKEQFDMFKQIVHLILECCEEHKIGQSVYLK